MSKGETYEKFRIIAEGIEGFRSLCPPRSGEGLGAGDAEYRHASDRAGHRGRGGFAELRDNCTAAHQRGVTELACAMAGECGSATWACERLSWLFTSAGGRAVDDLPQPCREGPRMKGEAVVITRELQELRP